MLDGFAHIDENATVASDAHKKVAVVFRMDLGVFQIINADAGDLYMEAAAVEIVSEQLTEEPPSVFACEIFGLHIQIESSGRVFFKR